jgi:phage baseplate assembly protein gpV
MECYVDTSEKDDNAKLRERLKVYKAFQIKYLHQEVLEQMLGVGAWQTYPKLAKEADINGGSKKTQLIARTKVLINTNVNVVTHLPTSEIFGPELENCGQHIDGILFLYEEQTSILTVKVRYKSKCLQKAKRKGWLPCCSDVFNNSAHSVKVGDMFPVDHAMCEVVHTFGGHEATLRRMENGVSSTMNVAEIICYLNESSLL